ncbi:aminodeoxychorismate lyase [Marinococcus halophilus]|uniref:aminodeoxychorismate lyase n=1 Tax=Marinococcus halophilus TaxID=1371 RepID=UPI0009A6125F|nr:aminodeoxychorismate lyase [Marinococcus halophilus]
MYVYIDGEIKKAGEARLSVFDHGFMYGLGLFETFRVYNGHPFLLNAHMERLEASAEELGIVFRYEREMVKEEIQQLLDANGLHNAYVRYNVSAGPGGLGLQTTPYLDPVTVIYMKPLPAAGAEPIQKDALWLQLRRNSPEGRERMKSHHYMNNWLAKQEMKDRPEAEGIFLNEQGYAAEGVVSNIFWRRGNTLYTPAVDTGILNGITRQFVIQLAHENDYIVEEGYFLPQDIEAAEEMFVTNSIQEIAFVRALEDRYFPSCSAAQLLHSRYREERETK